MSFIANLPLDTHNIQTTDTLLIDANTVQFRDTENVMKGQIDMSVAGSSLSFIADDFSFNNPVSIDGKTFSLNSNGNQIDLVGNTGFKAAYFQIDEGLSGGSVTVANNNGALNCSSGMELNGNLMCGEVEGSSLALTSAPHAFEYVNSRIQNMSPFKLGGALLEPPAGSAAVPLSVKQSDVSQSQVAVFYDDTPNPILEVLEDGTKVSKPLVVDDTSIDYYDGLGDLTLRHFGSSQFLAKDHMVNLQGNDYIFNTGAGGKIGIDTTAPSNRKLHVEDGGVIFKDGTAEFSIFTDAIYHRADYHVFRNNAGTERARIHNNGTMRTAYGTTGEYIEQGKQGSNFVEPSIYPSQTNYGYCGLSNRRWYYVQASNIDTTNAIVTSSDDRLKHNEEEVVGALEAINKLKLKKYDKTTMMLDENFNGNLENIPHQKEVGFIAQDVLNIPELAWLVKGGGTSTFYEYTDSKGNVVPEKTSEQPYSLEYQGLSNYAIQAIQELSKRVEMLETKLK